MDRGLAFALECRDTAILEAKTARKGEWFAVFKSVRLESEVADKDGEIESLQEDVAEKEGEIDSLQQDVADREGHIEFLQCARKAKGSRGMRKEINRLQREWAADHETGQEMVYAHSAEIEHLRGVLAARDAEIERHCHAGEERRGALAARDAQIQRLLQDNDSLSRGRAAETAPAAKDDAMAAEIERLRRAGREKEEEMASLSRAGKQAGEQARAKEESARAELLLAREEQAAVLEVRDGEIARLRASLAANDAELIRVREECKAALAAKDEVIKQLGITEGGLVKDIAGLCRARAQVVNPENESWILNPENES